MRVDEVSIGDYVLVGGEVAVLVIVEAVARLLPGVLGNPKSHAEDSFRTVCSKARATPGREVWRELRRAGRAALRQPQADRPLAA